jgi:predicted heme/steroid binding protein
LSTRNTRAGLQPLYMTSKKNNLLTRSELRRFNGLNGAPAYVGYRGRIYDVTESFLWPKGCHQGLHHAGYDLTNRLKEAPHDADQLEKFPLVGYLDEE